MPGGKENQVGTQSGSRTNQEGKESSKRGQASADKETSERIAREGGKASQGERSTEGGSKGKCS